MVRFSAMAAAGHCTPEGTRRYTSRFPDIPAAHWREFQGMKLSSIGIGTYLGPHTSEGDRRYVAAIQAAFRRGCNVLDTAVNYRCQRSERAAGRALVELIQQAVFTREEIFVCTKGGFLPFDGEPPSDAPAYFSRRFIRTGLARAEEIVSGHCMAPAFLRHQIETSLNNLRLEWIDLYYLHNPETQLSGVPRPVFEERLREAIRELEDQVSRGRIRAYGLATWDGLRCPPDHPSHISLRQALKIAESVAGKSHHLRAVQLPLNLRMLEACVSPSQETAGGRVPAIRAAAEFGLAVFTSAPLLQGELIGVLPAEARTLFPGLATDAQRAIQFARSTPGVTSSLVGMGDPAHVEENLATARTVPLGEEAYARLFT